MLILKTKLVFVFINNQITKKKVNNFDGILKPINAAFYIKNILYFLMRHIIFS